MNYRKIFFFVGNILIILGLFMFTPIIWTLYYGENDWLSFIFAGLITLFAGFLLKGNKEYNTAEEIINNREIILLVCLSWLFASIFGTLPYLLTGTFNNFTDAFFESMSAFTTTGASVIADYDALSHGILFWRSLSHWLGGMGIIVLFVAIMSTLKISGVNLFKTEIPGHTVQKIKPRIKDTAFILWTTYLILTVLLTMLLWYLGMDFFDALCHAFGTVATAGCSTKSESLAYFDNPYIYWAITLFMFLSGANLALYYVSFHTKSLSVFLKNAEFRLYTKLILSFTLIITAYLVINQSRDFSYAITYSAFKVVSFITTTGFVIDDYVKWPIFLQSILVGLMFIGGCNGSTSGSIKIGRHLILFKQIGNALKQAIHPRAVLSQKIDNKPLESSLILNVLVFFFLYVAIVSLGTAFMAGFGLEIKTAFTIVAASIGNLGIGIGQAGGPSYDFAVLPDMAKYFLNFLMLLGRLEIIPLIIIFTSVFWNEKG